MSNKQSSGERNDPSPRKGTCTTRSVLGIVQPNINRTQSLGNNVKVQIIDKSLTNAPRRSVRLSMARAAKTTESQQAVVKAVVHDQAKMDELNQRNQDVKPVRKNAVEGQGRQNIRNRNVQEVLPPHLHETRKASRRLSDEFDNFPAKRARQISHIIRKKQNRDGRPQEHHNLSLTNFEPTKYTLGFSPYDASIRGDVLQSPEYVSDIFQRLYHSETLNAPICYMHIQRCISASMRAILVDWIVDVHLKFRCVPETLHLAVNIIDRYLSAVEITRDILQLVGITALLLASKYEEIYPPEVKNCVMICQRAYNVQQVLDMEADMLSELSFNLTVPTGHPFLQRFLFITHATETMSIAANYYTERMLQEHDSLKYRPSIIAAAAVCLAINHPEIREFDEIETPKPGVPQVLVDYTGFTPEMIMNAAEFVASKVCESVKTKADRCLIAVQRKYSYSRYRHVSTYFESPDAVDILDDSS